MLKLAKHQTVRCGLPEVTSRPLFRAANRSPLSCSGAAALVLAGAWPGGGGGGGPAPAGGGGGGGPAPAGGGGGGAVPVKSAP